VKKLLTLLLFIVLFASSMYASGFQLNEHGARAMAMAGAFTGLANDPSAIYFNPAGITQLKGTQFYLGATMIMPLATYTTPLPNQSESEMVSQIFAPINFYITHQFSDKLAVGLSVNNQYGLGTKWDPNWVGKYHAIETKITSFFFTPVIAYKLTDNLSVSAGPTIAVATILISQKTQNPVNPAAPDFLTTFNGNNTTAVGFTAGILYRLNDQWQFGLSYRSQSKFSFTGTASSSPASFSFTHPQLGPLTLTWPTGGITAPLTTPQNATFGLAYTPDKQWTVTFDFQYVGWSSYDNLTVTFDNYDTAPFTPGVQNTESLPRDYQNTYIVRLGFEYKATDAFSLRWGVLYDHNPIKDAFVDPTLPDADRVGFNIGFGGKLTDHLGIDFSYMFLSFATREVTNSVFNFNGTYSNTAHLFGLDFSYSL